MESFPILFLHVAMHHPEGPCFSDEEFFLDLDPLAQQRF